MEIRHGRVSLWLERVRPGAGLPLLLLHELGGSGAAAVAAAGDALGAWPGPVYALDFSGHGRSGWLRGGAYSAELLAADADAALAALGGAAWLAGSGLGAYVALLLAGARPDAIAGAILWDGRGLDGGGAEPDFSVPDPPSPGVAAPASPELRDASATDPRVESALEDDVRPTDYAASFAAEARCLVLVEDGTPRPPWWETVRTSPTARVAGGDGARLAYSVALAARLAAGPGSAE